MNIFGREMKAHRKALILWCLGVFALVASGMGKFTVLSASGQSMNEAMSQLPRSLQVILGIGSFDITTASGYYGVLFVYLALMAGIHASMLGSQIIAKEERDRTSEFLLAKPISRSRIITIKLLAALTQVVILNLVTLISSIVIVGYYGKGESVSADILLLMAGMFILQLIFLVVGTGIAAISKRPKTAPAASAGVLLATYILSMVVDLSSRLGFLKYLTPFQYYGAQNLMRDNGLEPVYVILSVAIIAALLGATYRFYEKRDLHG